MRRSVRSVALACFLVAGSFGFRGAQDAAAPSQEGSPGLLPGGWTGTFEGKLEIFAKDGKRQPEEVPMRIEIGAASGGEAIPFKLTYGDPKTSPVRDYRLVPVEGEPNHFLNDEQNGIVLDTWLVGDTLYAQFEVAGSRIDSRFRLDGDRLYSEMATFGVIAARDTRPDGDSSNVIRSYPLQGVQRATLKRS